MSQLPDLGQAEMVAKRWFCDTHHFVCTVTWADRVSRQDDVVGWDGCHGGVLSGAVRQAKSSLRRATNIPGGESHHMVLGSKQLRLVFASRTNQH